MDLSDTFRVLVRRIVGLPDDEGQPPHVDRLAHYRARVDTCASDGSTLDVTPEDKRISAEKNVPLRVGVPGSTAVIQPGAIVWLGWDAGNPAKPHCLPCYESANVTKLVFTDVAGDSIELSNGTVTIKANAQLKYDAASVTITASGVAAIKGATVQLGNNPIKTPVLTVGAFDALGVPVTNSPTNTGTVLAG
jgi:hypothetical protein